MGLIVVAVVCGVLAGWALGGRLAALERMPVHGWRLLVLALAIQVVGALALLVGLPAGAVGAVTLTLSGALALLFCVRNTIVHGLILVGVGMLLNAFVIALNGGMPVSEHAAARAGVSWESVLDDSRREPATGDSLLRPLGAVIAVPLPVRPAVVSVGDLLVAAGLGQLVLSGMLYGGAGGPSRSRGRSPGSRIRGRGPLALGAGRRTERVPVEPEAPEHALPPFAKEPGRHRAPEDEFDSELVRVITRPKSPEPS